jgi:hypothetical protein
VPEHVKNTSTWSCFDKLARSATLTLSVLRGCERVDAFYSYHKLVNFNLRTFRMGREREEWSVGARAKPDDDYYCVLEQHACVAINSAAKASLMI